VDRPDVGQPVEDAEWNFRARHETTTARLDRNWGDLLQELRVTQTGVQLLTGLLLTVPFQARFTDLVPHQRTIYLVSTALAVLASGLLLSPVVLHRALFRRHERRVLVSAGQLLALAGFAVLGLAVVGVCTLIFDVVLGPVGGIAAGVTSATVFVLLWLVGPLLVRNRGAQAADDPPGGEAGVDGAAAGHRGS
jgi:Family of unknown function (DUF6328)